nr:cysteine hydrolase family protein [Listeria grandensis]
MKEVFQVKKGLIVVDVQNDYFEGGAMPLFKPNEALENAIRIQADFRAQGLPIFYVQHAGTSEAGFLVEGTEGAEIHAGLLPIATENEFVVRKTTPNSFFETDLGEKLKATGVEQVVIVGMMTHVCIDSTTRQASELGLSPIVIADACTGPDVVFDGRKTSAKDLQISFMAALGFFADVQPSYK